MYTYKAHITEVIDGDTFRATVDLGFYVDINITLRLLYIDTPEKFTAHKKGENEKSLGLICKEIAKRLFENTDVIIKTKKPDSFGRILCELWYYDSDGELTNIVDLYNELGINKMSYTYSHDKILEYGKSLNIAN